MKILQILKDMSEFRESNNILLRIMRIEIIELRAQILFKDESEKWSMDRKIDKLIWEALVEHWDKLNKKIEECRKSFKPLEKISSDYTIPLETNPSSDFQPVVQAESPDLRASEPHNQSLLEQIQCFEYFVNEYKQAAPNKRPKIQLEINSQRDAIKAAFESNPNGKSKEMKKHKEYFEN